MKTKTTTPLLLIALGLTLACFGLSRKAQAQEPDAPESILTFGNTFFGDGALVSLTTGVWDTALGFEALNHNTTGHNNTAVGCNAGIEATTGSNNIYIGNIGVADESNTIRIGDPAIHQNAFLAGIPAGGLAAILFDYNSGGITIGVGGAVPFNTAPLIVGTAVSKTNK